MTHYRPHPSRTSFQLWPCPTSFFPLLSYADFNCGQGLCSCLCTFSRTGHQTNGPGQFAGRAVARRHISSPRLFCIRLGEHSICVPLPLSLPLPTPKAEQSSVSTASFILLRALLYTTPTPLTFHNPLTLNPHLYLFIDHPHETFLPRQPCIGTCLIALPTVGVLVGLVAASPNVFGMSSVHARVVLCIPAHLYSLTPCRLVVLSVSSVPSPSVTIVANSIGLTLSAKFCHYGFGLDANSTTI